MKLKTIGMGVILLCVIACSAEDVAQDNAIGVRFSNPVETTRTIDPATLSVTLTIDGITRNVSSNASGTVWTGMFSLPADRAVELVVDWEHRGFPIARYSTTVGPITELTEFSIRVEDYVTTGEEFDADGDGFSNLKELINNTNPSDNQNIDVRIPAVSQAGAPGINGVTGAVWADNIITDWQTAQLSIDNLMIDLGATRADGETGFYWQALHNGSSLFIIVYAEDAANETPRADSTNHTRDDAINIFIDGDNSKLESYDGLNDYHFIIPFAKLRRAESATSVGTLAQNANGDLIFSSDGLLQVNTGDTVAFVPAADIETNTNNQGVGDDVTGARQSYGPQSAGPVDSILYVTGRPGEGGGQPQQVYEVKLNLQQLGISVGSPFGIEIQIDSDDDGGNRDARYGWKHPAKSTNGSDVNNSVSNPQFFGTAVLE